MGWQLPSLAALRTFEAAARHLSFTKAAAELNLTQSAVSRQIKELESHLGTRLFERIRQRVALSEAGQRFFPEARKRLQQTEETMLRRIEAGRVWLWTDERGTPVHLSAMNATAFGAARIGPVYTPKEHRGQGYAGNTVAALSRRILDAGAMPCLFTDQANPASNALYAALGYRPVVDMVNLLVR